MNIVAIGSTALALLVVGGVLLLQQNVSRLVRQVKSQASVVVYLRDDLPRDSIDGLKGKIISDPRVSDLEFKTKEEALSDFRRRLGENADVLSGLNANPLPASFHLSLKPSALDEIENVASGVRGMEGVESVQYGQDLIERLQDVSRVVQVLLAVVGGIICVVAIFIIFNTIQLSVVARQTEIEILKLVGATRWFIGLPFVAGGVIQGVLGTLLGVGFLGGLFWLIRTRLSALPFLTSDVAFLSGIRVGVLLLLGLLLGVFGSVTAVYRHVRHM